jgi:hypothetical protein
LLPHDPQLDYQLAVLVIPNLQAGPGVRSGEVTRTYRKVKKMCCEIWGESLTCEELSVRPQCVVHSDEKVQFSSTLDLNLGLNLGSGSIRFSSGSETFELELNLF